jgi:hypothetical protein
VRLLHLPYVGDLCQIVDTDFSSGHCLLKFCPRIDYDRLENLGVATQAEVSRQAFDAGERGYRPPRALFDPDVLDGIASTFSVSFAESVSAIEWDNSSFVNGFLYHWCDIASFYTVSEPGSEAEWELFENGISDFERNSPTFCEPFARRQRPETESDFAATAQPEQDSFDLDRPPIFEAGALDVADEPSPLETEIFSGGLEATEPEPEPPDQIRSEGRPDDSSADRPPRPKRIRFVAFGSGAAKSAPPRRPFVERADVAVQESPPMLSEETSASIARSIEFIRTFDLFEVDADVVMVAIGMRHPDVLCWTRQNKFVQIDADELVSVLVIVGDLSVDDAHRMRIGVKDRVRLVDGLLTNVEGTVRRTFGDALFLQLDDNPTHCPFWWALGSDAVFLDPLMPEFPETGPGGSFSAAPLSWLSDGDN